MGGIDLAGIGGLISALTGLLIGVGSFLLQRQRRQAVDADEMEEDLEVRTAQYRAALRHIVTMEDDYAAAGRRPPARPAELTPGYFQREQRAGKRGRHRGAAPADAGDGGSNAADGGAAGGGGWADPFDPSAP